MPTDDEHDYDDREHHCRRRVIAASLALLICSTYKLQVFAPLYGERADGSFSSPRGEMDAMQRD